MFTFGRDHEKKCGAKYVRNPDQVYLLMDVIDAIHDLIENKGSESSLIEKIRIAFINGGSGVWENAGTWLRKSSHDYPQAMLFEPDIALNFHLLRYQELLKPRFQTK